MKKFIIYLLILVCAQTVHAQCPPANVELYSKVMNVSFAEAYEKCPVIIEGEFLTSGGWKNYAFPKKIKSYVLFQCIAPGGTTQSSRSGEARGDIFCLTKQQAETLFTLQKGDNVKIEGTTYVHNYFGNKFVYFIATNIEKVL